MKRIICYGDSNTWGYNPEDGSRYDENTRWTSLLQKMLGDGYQVVECGINGRSTAFDEPFRECRNGCKGIGYVLLENAPVDLLIVSLGGNDLKYTTAAPSAKGLRALLREVVHSAVLDSKNRSLFRKETKILVVSPIPLGAGFDERFPDSLFYGKREESLRFAEFYRPVCKLFDADFLDAAQYAKASEIDLLHMDKDSHKHLAEAIYKKVMAMFQTDEEKR